MRNENKIKERLNWIKENKGVTNRRLLFGQKDPAQFLIEQFEWVLEMERE